MNPGTQLYEKAAWTAKAVQQYGIQKDELAEAFENMASVCRDAWTLGLMRGFNGNMSIRLASGKSGKGAGCMLITGTGVAKGHMDADSLALCDMEGRILAGAKISSETPMHVAVYGARPDAGAVLHVHPAALLALSMRLKGQREEFLRMPVLESEIWLKQLGFAPFFPNGSQELAHAVARGFADPLVKAVFMEGHGLCSIGKTAAEALAVCEELEHMGRMQLMSLPG